MHDTIVVGMIIGNGTKMTKLRRGWRNKEALTIGE